MTCDECALLSGLPGIAAIFEYSVGGGIPIAVVKINKMVESGSPRLEVNEVLLLLSFFNNNCIIK